LDPSNKIFRHVVDVNGLDKALEPSEQGNDWHFLRHSQEPS